MRLFWIAPPAERQTYTPSSWSSSSWVTDQNPILSKAWGTRRLRTTAADSAIWLRECFSPAFIAMLCTFSLPAPVTVTAPTSLYPSAVIGSLPQAKNSNVPTISFSLQNNSVLHRSRGLHKNFAYSGRRKWALFISRLVWCALAVCACWLITRTSTNWPRVHTVLLSFASFVGFGFVFRSLFAAYFFVFSVRRIHV